MKKHRNKSLLGGVSAAAILALGTSFAFAASTNVTYTIAGVTGVDLVNATATGHQAIDGINWNQGLVSSSVSANVGADAVLGGVVSSSSTIVGANRLSASAMGNSLVSTADLEAIGVNGIGIVNAAVNNRAAAAVTSAVANSAIDVSATTLASGSDSFVNSANTIAANTTLNSSTIASSGAIPNAFSDLVMGGAIDLSFSPIGSGNLLTSQGSIAASNNQLNSVGVSGRSSASVSGNSVSMALTPNSIGQVLSSSPAVDGNSISADYTGNAADTQIAVTKVTDADSGMNPTFNGSVAASNLQANLQGDEGADADIHRSSNIGSTIGASVGMTTPGVQSATLRGELSLSQNTISSSTVGNKTGTTETAFGTEVQVAAGISYVGRGAGGEQANSVGLDGFDISGDLNAGLSLLSAQVNVNSTHDSVTEGASIASLVQNLANGTVNMASNSVASSATGNDASSRILSQGIGTTETPTFEGTAALANAQVNNGSPISATAEGTDIRATIGNASATGGGSLLSGSSVSVAGNTVDADAVGNAATSVVAIGANAVDLGAGPASVTAGNLDGAEISAAAGASLTNLQGNYQASAVTATNVGTTVVVGAQNLSSAVSDTTVAVKGNKVGSSALGNDAGNTLALQGTNAAGSAGLGSVQVVSSGSDVTALTAGAQIGALVGNNALSVGGSSSTVEGNRTQADAIANRVNNAFSVTGTNSLGLSLASLDATTIDIVSDALNGAIFDEANPTVNTSMALLNSQILDADASASVMNSAFGNVSASLMGGSIATNKNVLHAQAVGNEASSKMTLDVGNIGLSSGGGGFASVADVTSVQSRTDGSDVIAEVAGSGTEFAASIDGLLGSLANGTAEVSGNRSEALAQGNTATNGMTVAANSLDLASPQAMHGLSIGRDSISSDLGFSVVNAQSSGSGNVSATQGDVQALASVSDNVMGSSVTLASNAFTAGAYDNGASNSLSIDATTAMTSGGVANYQSANSTTLAKLGAPGVKAVAGGSYNTVATNIDPATNNPVIGFTLTNLGDGDYAYSGLLFTSSNMSAVPGWSSVPGEPGWYQQTVTGYVVDSATYTALNQPGGGAFNFSGTTPGFDGSNATPSVIAQVGGTIVDSAVSVTGSKTQATALSNSADNTLVVAGNVIEGGSVIVPGATIDLVSGQFGSVADFAVANVQLLDTQASTTAEANGTYAIDADAAIIRSALAVTGTRQQAAAEGNQATNSLNLSATNLTGVRTLTASLLSAQIAEDGLSPISATGWMAVSAPAAVSNSSVDLSDNRNVALAVANEVVNALGISGTNLNGVGVASASTEYPFEQLTTIADYMANSAQASDRDVAAVATTTIQNQDAVATATSGIADSTVSISGNATIANALGNRASTSVNVAADAGLDATSALLSTQVSDADITSTASGSVDFALASNTTGPAAATVSNSSLLFSGNQISALSISNDVTNASKVSGTKVDTVGGAMASAILGGNMHNAFATHIVNNGQASSGVASATADGSVNANLTATAASGTTMSLSSVMLKDNVTAAEARGNNASNTLALDGSASLGASAAVLNVQKRSIDGSVSATATGNVSLIAFADVAGASASQSSFGLTGNTTQSVASANSATNTLDASAGAMYGAIPVPASGSAGYDFGSAFGVYAVLNGQWNDASVTSTASATYSGDLVRSVSGSSVNVAGNTVVASAAGNTANNGIVLNSLPSGNPSASLSSTQVNTASVTALATGTSIGLSAGSLAGGVTGSTLGVRGNTVSASATGNSVVNSIKAR